MAKKTVGRQYLVWPDEGYNRGFYYFANYCPFCKKKNYLTTEDAQLFLNNASMWLKREGLLKILKRKVSFKMPRVVIKVQWGGEVREEKQSYPQFGQLRSIDTISVYDKI